MMTDADLLDRVDELSGTLADLGCIVHLMWLMSLHTEALGLPEGCERSRHLQREDRRALNFLIGAAKDLTDKTDKAIYSSAA